MSDRRALPIAPRPIAGELLSSWQGRVACRYGLAGDELRVCGVGNHHREAQLGRRQRQVLIKRRHRRNAVVDGFGCGPGSGERIAVLLHLADRNQQQRGGFARPDQAAMPDKGENAVAIGSPGVNTLGAMDPAFKELGDARIKVLALCRDTCSRLTHPL